MSTVLLVEDEPLLAFLEQAALQDAGYGVCWAADAHEAAAVLDRICLGLAALVTDVRLGPGPSGFAFARLARERRPDLPVVYVTADSEAEFAREGVPGATLLSKPVSPGQLVAAVGRAIVAAGVQNPRATSVAACG